MWTHDLVLLNIAQIQWFKVVLMVVPCFLGTLNTYYFGFLFQYIYVFMYV